MKLRRIARVEDLLGCDALRVLQPPIDMRKEGWEEGWEEKELAEEEKREVSSPTLDRGARWPCLKLMPCPWGSSCGGSGVSHTARVL